MKKYGFTFRERKLIYIDGAATQETQPVTPPTAEVKPQPTLAAAAEKAPAQPEAQKPPEQLAATPDAAATLNTQTKENGSKRFALADKNLNTLAHISV